LAQFVTDRSWDGLTEVARGELKIRVLDGLGCGLGALEASTVQAIRAQVNLFVDDTQIVQLECLRASIWGTDDTWGRMLTYRGPGGGGDPRDGECGPGH
jgi:hypothetical protein